MRLQPLLVAIGLWLLAGCGDDVPTPHAATQPHSTERPAQAHKQVGHVVHTDVDGDGHDDRAALFAGWRTPWDGWRDHVVVHLATGRVVSVPVEEQGSYRYPYTRLLGHADVNDDGRGELVLLTGGNTSHQGVLVTDVQDELVVVQPLLSFYGHGNACGPWCDLTTSCQNVRGQPRVVTVEGRNTWRYGRPGDHYRKQWQVIVYRLDGARLVRTETHRGSTTRNAPLPTAWPFLNGLSCGTADWPDF